MSDDAERKRRQRARERRHELVLRNVIVPPEVVDALVRVRWLRPHQVEDHGAVAAALLGMVREMGAALLTRDQ